ncbi:MAG: class I mannose-6-phosphate isomerase [Hyphomicrobiaceae bacterium]
MRAQYKPWGVTDPRPWSNADHAGHPIGELCYERSSPDACEPALLLKILLTSQPLSIQVHPDDAFAQSIGLPHGKTEAWYVLGAQPGAAVALGLKHAATPHQMNQAIADGSIADLVAWRTISLGETVFVPAGTIHAIGPGLVIAEIQQRSDATFRLFDHGRDRELHVDHGLAAARAAPTGPQPDPRYLANGRTLLVSNAHFVFERLELEPGSAWRLDASRETWLLILQGRARANAFDVGTGQAVFAQAESIDLRVGEKGAVCLVAYTGRGGPLPQLLRRRDDHAIDDYSKSDAQQQSGRGAQMRAAR